MLIKFRTRACLLGLVVGLGCQPLAEQAPADFVESLERIEGMSVLEIESEHAGYRAFRLTLEMPVDHGDSTGARFTQRATLHHREASGPMVMASTGYSLMEDLVGQWMPELTILLSANQLSVEHRYYGGSRPDDADWRFLNVRQAAADQHRWYELLREVYPGRWLASGVSKGGISSLLYQRFFPGDMDGVVAYVAPLTLGAPDRRYPAHLDSLGPPACRAAVEALQRAAIERAGELSAALENEITLSRTDLFIGVLSVALNYRWQFWQWQGLAWCEYVPSPEAPVEEILSFMLMRDAFAPGSSEDNEPFAFQSDTELGFPESNYGSLVGAINWDYLAGEDLGEEEPAAALPWGETPPFDPFPMLEAKDWLADNDERTLLVYGELDPWTGGRVELPDATHTVMVEGGTHASRLLHTRDEDALANALSLIEEWADAPTNAGPRRGPPINARMLSQARLRITERVVRRARAP